FLKGGFFLFSAVCGAGTFRTVPAGYARLSQSAPGHDIPVPCVHVIHAAQPVHSQRQPHCR
ncbi:hypothetical protein MLZ30_021970, partial [Escherichia coli]|nr:hypothetical protein [Escherichia coli]